MKNQPNQTSELQINLAKFEELAREFIGKQSNLKDELWTTDEEQSKFWIDAFKEFIFSDQLNQQKRKEEYFKLKEQLESMKAEFEPGADETVTQDNPESWVLTLDRVLYKTEPEEIGCKGCVFIKNAVNCDKATDKYSCNAAEIIWKKK